MRKARASHLLAATGIAIGLAGVGLGVTHAASSTTATANGSVVERINPMSGLVQAIADKFGLNKVDVQAVFDEQHSKMEAERQQAFKDRLRQAVTDGKLTQEQADKITAKLSELEAQRESNKTAFESMTETERRAAMQTQMDALKTWATDNNIPDGYLPFGPGGRGGHRGGPGMMFEAPAPDATTTPAS